MWRSAAFAKRGKSLRMLMLGAYILFALVIFNIRLSIESQHIDGRTRHVYRDEANKWGYLNFMKYPNTYLNVSGVAKALVLNFNECALMCANSSTGVSFNFRVIPDSNGLHWCKVLSKDRFIAEEKVVSNTNYVHYTVSVSTSCYQIVKWVDIVSVPYRLAPARPKQLFSNRSKINFLFVFPVIFTHTFT